MIDEKLFYEFTEARSDIKRPMTERAKRMLRRKLDRLDGQGYDPDLLIERSIIYGWMDVYSHDSCKKSTVGFIERHQNTAWATGIPLDTSSVKQEKIVLRDIKRSIT